MGLWGRTLRGGIWTQSWKKQRREPSRYLGAEPSSKGQKQKSTHSTVRRPVWLEGNEQRWGRRSGASLGQPQRLWWELGLLLWITWRHPAFRMDGSRKLWKWRAKSPRTMGSLLLWIQLLTSSWANRMFPAQPPEGSTFCRHRKRELGYVPPQAQSNPARGQSGCFAWKNFHLAFHAFFMGQNQIGQYAKRKFGSQNSVHLPGSRQIKNSVQFMTRNFPTLMMTGTTCHLGCVP